MSILEIKLVEGHLLKAEPGDVVVFTIDEPITDAHAALIRQRAKEAFGEGIKFWVLDNGTKVSLLRGLTPDQVNETNPLRSAADIVQESPMSESMKDMQAAVDAFNKRYAVEDVIRVRPILGRDTIVERVVAAPGAYILDGHTPVVQVIGGGGCFALTHVVEETP